MSRFSWLRHPWLTVRVQLALGAVFVAAALPKIADPPGFAQMVYNYRLLPGMLVNPLAAFLPWLELLCGLALILGLYRRTAVRWIAFLLLVFVAALLVNLARGQAIDCGCFSTTAAGESHSELIAAMRWTVLRDLGMLLMAAQLLLAWRQEDRSFEALCGRPTAGPGNRS